MNHLPLGRVMFAVTGADFRHCCPLSMTESHCCFTGLNEAAVAAFVTKSLSYTKIHKYVNLTEKKKKKTGRGVYCVQFEGIFQTAVNPHLAPRLTSGLGSVQTQMKRRLSSH